MTFTTENEWAKKVVFNRATIRRFVDILRNGKRNEKDLKEMQNSIVETTW